MLTSALAENFLRKLHKQKYINYVEATEIVETKEDLVSTFIEDGWPRGADIIILAGFRSQDNG